MGVSCLSSVQFHLVTQSCLTLCNTMDCSTSGFPVEHQHLEIAQTYIHQVGDATQPFNPLLSLSPPALNLSQAEGLFQGVNSSHQVPKSWLLCFSISPSNEYSEMISFRINWLDHLAVQKTLKNLLQQHSSKGSILWCSAVRQHIKKQRHYFANKGPYSQAYGFSSCHVQV